MFFFSVLLIFTANTGAALSGILFFCMYLPYFFLEQRYTTLSQGAKVFACLDFQVAMAFGGKLLGMFEGVGEYPLALWGPIYLVLPTPSSEGFVEILMLWLFYGKRLV